MIQSKIYTLQGAQHRKFLLDITFPPTGNKKPIIIFVHGFKGFKDWGHFNLIANCFAENNFVLAKFNFSHNGTTIHDSLNFVDLNAFGKNNYLYELFDLKCVVDFLFSNSELQSEFDLNKIYLIGHSRGGGISILAAINDNRIKKLVTWAAVADIINRFSKQQINEWNKNNVIYVLNSRTGQNLPMYKQFYDVLVNNQHQLNISENLGKLKIPFLIVHGTNDQSVNVNEAYTLKEKYQRAELLLNDGADHTFGGAHPWIHDSLPKDTIYAIDKTIQFLNK